MIRSFKRKALEELWVTGSSRRIRPDLHARILRRLDALDQTERLSDLDIPGFGTHPLRGKPRRHAIWVNGPWRITFEWRQPHAWNVDLEQYH